MAAFIYDGKSSLTAAQTDTVIITADPTLFTQATQNVNNVNLQFGANTLTITGATLTTDASVATSLKNVSLAGGTFSVNSGATATSTTASSLFIGTDGTSASFTTGTTAADSKNALFGGNGISSPNDGTDSFTIGGQGSFLVYGNGGADRVLQNATAFDSTSAVTIFGGKGTDSIDLTNVATNKGSMLIYGGEDTDTIKVINAGTTTIFGGTGAGDSADGADFIGLSTSGGKITVFGNGGADIISGNGANTFGAATATAFKDGTNATIYGGTGSDSVTLGFDTGAKGTITVYGGEDADRIQVVNTGTTTIYGGTGQGDSTDGNDSIGLGASGGSITVFANAGADIVSADGTNAYSGTLVDGANATIYGGKGNDSVLLGFTGTTAKGSITVYGGEDQDSITVGNNVGGTTTVYGGLGQGDSADGADTISIIGAGNVTVFGNGGNDTINLNQYTGGTASTNVVTVYGGTGNDSINIGSVVNNQGTYNLNGNEGADTFVLGNTFQNETGALTFTDLANTQSVTVGGLVFTATGATTAAQLSAAFANLAAGATTGTAGSGVTGTFSGALSNNFVTGSANATNTGVSFAGSAAVVSAEVNPGDLTVSGTGVTITSYTQAITSQSSGTGVSILDFTVGTDKLSIQNGVSGNSTIPTITTVPTNGFSDLQSALNAASQNAAKGSIGAVAFQGSTYVVTNNDGVAGFNTANDVALKLTGVTDVNGVVNSITVL